MYIYNFNQNVYLVRPKRYGPEFSLEMLAIKVTLIYFIGFSIPVFKTYFKKLQRKKVMAPYEEKWSTQAHCQLMLHRD